ncbi:protein FAR1-RELATED SEQUENCE 5-like [Arachis ipaensis]|uniref:protein FAR1-RELATED SEQUENCE 5-like n=1 Tax=Arachis ipaensis TaxID=130454 RepID=UPI0007AF07AA|nr:protein FAR1-RELATED SEQUENCE 5-like [Arachis ipaensis]XP_025664853.1 protein FAR1-RELATED SEQUENCE 5-like [Arachis hypogaea]
MVGFEVKDIYNAIEKQRRAGTSDTDNALTVFGDVIGFDATYGRNKYKCPLVIFSGVDHHMRTIVFGCTVLSKEGEESYVWLLRAFLKAMKGKAPKSVITDGDQAMKSAIKAVDDFEDIWNETVEEFGLQQNSWVKDMYEKKHMWSNAHIRGKFFAGLKTTSRRVVVADYKSAYGDPVVKTRLEELEWFAATVYTRKVFVLFREVLLLTSNVRVVSSKKTSTCTLFEVAMYRQGRSWNISWGEMDDEFRCSYLRMESIGIPCVHIVGVLIRLNMVVIPDSLVLGR